MKNDSQVPERRRASRCSVFISAWISHPSQAEELRCKVREISQDGALLELPQSRDLPLGYWLRLEGETTNRFCTTAWRLDCLLGVEFSLQIIARGAETRVAAMCGWF